MFRQATEFLKEAEAELKKVVWPTRKKAVKLTVLVIFISAFTSFYLSLLDGIFSRAIKLILRGGF